MLSSLLKSYYIALKRDENWTACYTVYERKLLLRGEANRKACQRKGEGGKSNAMSKERSIDGRTRILVLDMERVYVERAYTRSRVGRGGEGDSEEGRCSGGEYREERIDLVKSSMSFLDDDLELAKAVGASAVLRPISEKGERTRHSTWPRSPTDLP